MYINCMQINNMDQYFQDLAFLIVRFHAVKSYYIIPGFIPEKYLFVLFKEVLEPF